MFFQYVSVGFPLISGIVLVPLYLSHIPLAVYGAWLATGNIVAWLTIVDPGLSAVLIQKVSGAHAVGNRKDLGGLMTNGILLGAAFSTAALAVGIIAGSALDPLLKVAAGHERTVVLQSFFIAVIATALMMFSYSITSINLGLQSSLGVGLVSTTFTLASYGVTVALLLAGFGLLSIPVGLVCRALGLIIGNSGYLLWRTRQEEIQFTYSAAGLRDLAHLMSYSFLGRTSEILATNLDALVVMRFLGPEAVPVLVLTRKAPELSRTLLERPAFAFMPAVAGLYATGNVARTKDVLSRLMRWTLWATGLAFVGFVSLNGAFVSLWVGRSLFPGALINAIIIVGLSMQVLTGVLAGTCLALGNIKGNSIARFVQGIVSVALLILGVRYFGLLGVVLAPVLATFLVGGAYYPAVFAKLLALTTTETSALVKEALRTVTVAIITCLLASPMNAATWMSLVLASMAITSLYGALLLLLSPDCRREFVIAASRLRFDHR